MVVRSVPRQETRVWVHAERSISTNGNLLHMPPHNRQQQRVGPQLVSTSMYGGVRLHQTRLCARSVRAVRSS